LIVLTEIRRGRPGRVITPVDPYLLSGFELQLSSPLLGQVVLLARCTRDGMGRVENWTLLPGA